MKKKGCKGCSQRTHLIFKFLLTMKLVILFILAVSMQSFARGYGQGISLKLEKVQLKKVFKAIEEQGIFRFVYKDAILPRERVSIRVENASLDEVMLKLLGNTSLSYRQLNENLIVITSALLRADEKVEVKAVPVGGRVINANAEPLTGVSVQEKGTNNIVVTKEDGSFSIDVTGTNAVLVFTSVGFQPQEVTIGNNKEINITLQAADASLNEVVVIGYGSRRKKDITGAVSTIEAKNIEKNTSLTPELAMQGQMAGVNITSAGGSPTARPTIRIRGVSTFNSPDPLYVIDGIPIVEGGAGATVDKVNDPTRRGGINLYTIINPNDIESITVLKDASASAIYGVRAANGVILITTKSGKKGRVRVDFDASYGIQRIPKTYDVLNTQQYTKFYTDLYNANPDEDSGNPIPIDQADDFGPLWNPSNSDHFGSDPTYDWQDAILNKNSKIQNYNVRASGGTESTTFNLSVGYSNNDGPFVGYNAKRYSISSNLISKIGKYIEVGLNVRGVQQETYDPVGISLDIWKAAPWQKIYDASGPNGYAPIWKLNAPITPGTFNKSTLYAEQYVAYSNPLGLLSLNDNKITDQSGFGTGYIQLQPIAGLKIKGTFSAQQTSISSKSWDAFDTWWFEENPGNPYDGVNDPITGTKPGFVGFNNSTTTSTIKSLNIDYLKSFAKHNLNITLDASQQEYDWRGNGANRSIVTNDPTLRYFSTTGKERGYYELRAKYALIGYLARVTYNYAGKYYIEGLVRRDGSSRFVPGKQWGTFPSGSLAWRVSQEDFMSSVKFVNDLKIRGGYGLLGNEQTTGGWAYISVAGVVPPAYNLGTSQNVNTGIAFTTFPNAELTWEKLYSANIGFDALLFNNQVTLTVDYFNKITKGIIQSVRLVPSSGIPSPTDLNIADVKNTGVEFSVGYNRKFGNVGVNFNANFTAQKNRVVKLANGDALRGDGLEAGYPIGFIYGYQVGGIFQTEKEIEDWNNVTGDGITQQQRPGDIYFADLFGSPEAGSSARNFVRDSIVNSNDQVYLGKTIPGYYYGFSAGADYKGFDVSIFFQGRGDVQKYNFTKAAGEGMNGFGRNQFTSVLNAWTAQNPSTTMPRAVYGDPNGNLRTSSRFVENAGFLRLQNLQIGYTFPKKITDKTAGAIQNFRIYVTGVNLFTITDYSGLDPENELSPSTRQFLVGVKATF